VIGKIVQKLSISLHLILIWLQLILKWLQQACPCPDKHFVNQRVMLIIERVGFLSVTTGLLNKKYP
jgi:hypothetical protein